MEHKSHETTMIWKKASDWGIPSTFVLNTNNKKTLISFISKVKTLDQVVSDPLTVVSHSGEHGRRSPRASSGPEGDDSDQLPRRDIVLPRHQRSPTVSITAVFPKLASSTDLLIRPRISCGLWSIFQGKFNSKLYVTYPERSKPRDFHLARQSALLKAGISSFCWMAASSSAPVTDTDRLQA